MYFIAYEMLWDDNIALHLDHYQVFFNKVDKGTEIIDIHLISIYLRNPIMRFEDSITYL